MILPREIPSRDARYMGEAWIKAAFSKDPNTQVGAVLVTADNEPLSAGYNGPPPTIDDRSFSWERPQTPDDFSKYDVVYHAEENAIRYAKRHRVDLTGTTLYVTAHPCKDCMLQIITERISRVVYFDYGSDSKSILQSQSRLVSEKIASLASYKLVIEEFQGDLSWLANWTNKLQGMGVIPNLKS